VEKSGSQFHPPDENAISEVKSPFYMAFLPVQEKLDAGKVNNDEACCPLQAVVSLMCTEPFLPQPKVSKNRSL
jgi:hypothetical protein